MTEIAISPKDEPSRGLWSSLADLVDVLPDDWVLIGGLMVQLHAIEHGHDAVRATVDIDVLGQGRPQGALSAIDKALKKQGFGPVELGLDSFTHRYERDGLVVDVLGPDGMDPPPRLGGRNAVGVPGGSQALARSEAVDIKLGGRTFSLRRPTLLGAILIKARSLMVHSDPDAQREDLLVLLSIVDDPREMAMEITNRERTWLRRAEARLRFEEPSLLALEAKRRARLAFRLLAASS